MATRVRGAYGFADLGRAGFGNKLFPYARCFLWCAAHGVRMLPARFVQLPIGPLLRGERDLRLYADIVRTPRVVDVARRTAALALLRPESEVADQTFARAPRRGRVYRFAGLGRYFETLNGHHEALHAHLTSLLRSEHLRVVDAATAPIVGVHVRLGDFSGNMRHPIEWYVEALELVRRTVGWVAPATVFSDGKPEELAPLLRLPAVQRAEGPNALVDILHLARSRFLVGTGSSTFGAWSAFLGQMPAMSRQGNPFSWWHLENRAGRFIGEVDLAAPPGAFVDDVRRALPMPAKDP